MYVITELNDLSWYLDLFNFTMQRHRHLHEAFVCIAYNAFLCVKFLCNAEKYTSCTCTETSYLAYYLPHLKRPARNIGICNITFEFVAAVRN
jgi:hypothetical protein